MPKRDSADEYIASLQAAGLNVSAEDKAEIDLFEKGKALAQVINFYGWEVAVSMLESYAIKATDELLSISPGDPTVLAAHAAASAACQLVRLWKQDVQTAIEKSLIMPEAMKRGVKIARSAPIESM